MLSLMVGPWSGIRPRPTQVPPSDVGHGLSSNIRCATSVESRVFSAADTITLEKSCINSNKLGLSGRYPTGQGITLFEVRWSP
jgi:hypothetical protein